MPSPFKLHIHCWGERKPINLMTVCLAQQVAVGAEMVHDLVLRLRKGVVDEELPARPRASR